jgi:hypothetical protein
MAHRMPAVCDRRLEIMDLVARFYLAALKLSGPERQGRAPPLRPDIIFGKDTPRHPSNDLIYEHTTVFEHRLIPISLTIAPPAKLVSGDWPWGGSPPPMQRPSAHGAARSVHGTLTQRLLLFAAHRSLKIIRAASSLPLKADIARRHWHVRLVPQAAMCAACKSLSVIPPPSARPAETIHR